jgi:hypothetical protein
VARAKGGRRRARALRILGIGGLLALSTAALAQSLDVEGDVVHGETGQPIAGAVVEVWRTTWPPGWSRS